MVIRYESISFWQQDDAPWDRACEALAQLTPGLGPSPANPRTPSPVARIRPFKGIQGKVCTKNMDGTSFKSALEQSFATCVSFPTGMFSICFSTVSDRYWLTTTVLFHTSTRLFPSKTRRWCVPSQYPQAPLVSHAPFSGAFKTSSSPVWFMWAMSMPCQCHVNAMSMPCQCHVNISNVSTWITWMWVVALSCTFDASAKVLALAGCIFLLHQVTGPCSNRPCVDWMVKGICHRLAVYHVNLYDAEYRECVRLCNLCTNMYRTCILLLYLSSDALASFLAKLRTIRVSGRSTAAFLAGTVLRLRELQGDWPRLPRSCLGVASKLPRSCLGASRCHFFPKNSLILLDTGPFEIVWQCLTMFDILWHFLTFVWICLAIWSICALGLGLNPFESVCSWWSSVCTQRLLFEGALYFLA
jgi:hypothetical protein